MESYWCIVAIKSDTKVQMKQTYDKQNWSFEFATKMVQEIGRIISTSEG